MGQELSHKTNLLADKLERCKTPQSRYRLLKSLSDFELCCLKNLYYKNCSLWPAARRFARLCVNEQNTRQGKPIVSRGDFGPTKYAREIYLHNAYRLYSWKSKSIALPTYRKRRKDAST